MDIYKITNLANDKVYIGQSARGVEGRFHRHIQDAMRKRLDTHFARAIRMYGPENFVVEVIDTAETQDELNQKEQYWIRYYDSIKHGYNETDATYKCGGNTYKGKNDLEMYVIGERIRATKLGSKNPHARKVKCRNEWTDEEFFFDTLKECQEFFGEKSHRFISARLNRNIGSLYLGEWNFAYQGEPYMNLVPRVNRRGCSVYVTDLGTGKKSIYPSVHMTSRELGIPRHLMDRRFRKDNSCIINNYKITILD